MPTALVVQEQPVRSIAEQQSVRDAVTAGMSFEQIVQMGDQLVRTGFLPTHIKTGVQVAAIVLAGQELGMMPMRSIRSLVLVQGKVVENADSQLARFKADGGRAVWKRLDEQGATLWLRHPNGDEHEESFTMDDAVRAKLSGKDIWKSYPKAMLRSRVITAALKSIGWEGGVGAYDPDEAAAFTVPAPLSAAGGPGVGASAAPIGDESIVEMTIDVALAMPLPGAKSAWNGKGGTPLGQLSAKMIPAIRDWVAKKIRAAADEDADVPATHQELVRACDLILEMREAEQDDSVGATDATEKPKTARPDALADDDDGLPF